MAWNRWKSHGIAENYRQSQISRSQRLFLEIIHHWLYLSPKLLRYISLKVWERDFFCHYCIFIKIKIKIDVFSINSFSQVQWDFLIILGSLNSYESEFSENICFGTFRHIFGTFSAIFRWNFFIQSKTGNSPTIFAENSRYYILYDEYIYILKVYRQTVSMSLNMLKNLL